MRVTPFVLICLFLAHPAAAFKGRIVDQQGRPVAKAIVSILGRTGEAITDPDGRFEWKPDPPTPFEIFVIDANGNYAKPVLIETLDPSQELLVTVTSLVSESVTVTGSAPSIESTPGSGTTSLSGRDVAVRQPSNLMQAIENVAGVNQVSEGQAAVPAIRGLARGRTLILIDGARVSSERRVGPSATYLDPSLIEGVDVARGPGSVAYGSDAFGGVISVRTRRVVPGSPLAFQFSGTVGTGIPERRAAIELSKGLPQGGVIFARICAMPTTGTAPTTRCSTPGTVTAVSSFGSSRRPARASSAPAGRATSAATSNVRVTTRVPSASSTRRRTRIVSRRATKPKRWPA